VHATTTINVDEITADLECNAATETVSAMHFDTGTVTTFNDSSLPLRDAFADEVLRATYGLNIDASSFTLTASNALDQSVGQSYTWTDLVSLDMVLVPLTEFSACIGTPGCDGFILSTAKVVGSFPRTATRYLFTFQEIYSVLNVTQQSQQQQVGATTAAAVAVGGSRRRLMSASPDMVPFATSDPRTFEFNVTQTIHNQVFANTDDTHTVIIVVGVIGGVLGLCALFALLMSIIRQPLHNPQNSSFSRYNNNNHDQYDSDPESTTELTRLRPRDVRIVERLHPKDVKIVESLRQRDIRIV
jgi:hypothetical protein